MDIVRRAFVHATRARTAIVSDRAAGVRHSYGALMGAAARTAEGLLRGHKGQSASLSGSRVGLVCGSTPEWAAGAFATWLAGAILVPLSPIHPTQELQHVIDDAGIGTIMASSDYIGRAGVLAPNGVRVHEVVPVVGAGKSGGHDDDVGAYGAMIKRERGEYDDGSIIVYTSGTTGKPKGAMHTHGSLIANITSMEEAWEWRPSDAILHCLPLHHVHGVFNALLTPLHTGAAVEFLPGGGFKANAVWDALLNNNSSSTQDSHNITIFMGVPTMYHRLLKEYQAMPPHKQAEASEAARSLRLAVSGSAPCPIPLANEWAAIAGGLPPLERYGMTEIGMALSNTLTKRVPGAVGTPMPGVQVKLVPDKQATGAGGRAESSDQSEEGDGVDIGELYVRGGNVIKEYWGKPEATREAFDEDGWFKTGDIASYDGSVYRILGRSSVDIIKSGGYKLSALEIENALLEHPGMAECAVVAVPDADLGEAVGALVVLREGDDDVDINDNVEERLRQWAKSRMAAYKVPRRIVVTDAIPRNAMGKVNKRDLRKSFFVDTPL